MCDWGGRDGVQGSANNIMYLDFSFKILNNKKG
jgi:hypothetical protein